MDQEHPEASTFRILDLPEIPIARVSEFLTGRETQLLSWSSHRLREIDLVATREFIKATIIALYIEYGRSTDVFPVVEFGSLRDNLPWITEQEFQEIRPLIRFGDWDEIEELEDSGDF